MRITKQIREQVLKVMATKVFQARLDEISTAMIGVIDGEVKAFYKNDHARGIALGKDNEDLLITVRRRFGVDRESFDFQIPSLSFNLLDKSAFNATRWQRLNSSVLTFFSSRANSHIYDITPSKKAVERLENYVSRFEALSDEYDQFVTDLKSVLLACKTKKQLLEVLPEVEEFLPEEPKKLPMPIDKAKSVRTKISAAA